VCCSLLYMDQRTVFNDKCTPLVCTMSTVLDTPWYIFSVKEEFQGGLNGVEVVIFQQTDIVGGVTAHYVSPCAAQKGCVQQWTKVL
jgi:hypothetical protein